MKKLYRPLTKDQIKRGVMFSSCLSESKVETGRTHEIMQNDSEAYRKILRIKNESYCNRSHFKYNIIRQ